MQKTSQTYGHKMSVVQIRT